MNNRLGMDFLGGQQWKALFQIETHLITKYTNGAGAGTVGLASALLKNVAKEVVVLLHNQKSEDERDKSTFRQK
ncbi:hypothetical protein GCM10028809_02850 [Spirosoma gilvum]